MCKVTRTQPRSQEHDTRETTQRLRGGSAPMTCEHRAKKKLFAVKDVRKKLKGAVVSKCEDCLRAAKTRDNTKECPPTSVCMGCGVVSCDAHAMTHAKASRSGECHVIFFLLKTSSIRCLECDCDLPPLENASNDHIKMIINEMKSLTNKKKVEDARRKGCNNVSVEGAPLASKENLSEDDCDDERVSNNNNKPVNGCKVSEDDENPAVLSKKNKRKEKKDSAKVAVDHGKADRFPSPKGLANLGNTCYFNSVCQSIIFTHPMQYYYDRFGRVETLIFDNSREMTVDDKKVDLKSAKIQVNLDSRPLNDVLAQLARDYENSRSLNPGALVSKIQAKTKIRVYQQQDAHELLRYLLDGLRSEETDAYKKAIANHLGVPLQGNKSKVDPELARQAKGYLEAAGRPLLDSVFGGRLQQTIRCLECGHISQQSENFLDLSLPVPSQTRQTAGRESISNKKSRRIKGKKSESSEDGRLSAGNDCGDPDIDVTDLNEEFDDLNLFDEHRKDPVGFTKSLVPPPTNFFNESRNVGALMVAFMAEERLDGQNKYECEKCCAPHNKKNDLKTTSKRRVAAIKRYLIAEPPAVLTLHLKRFSQTHSGRGGLQKISGHIKFPIIFDIAPFCCQNVQRVAPGQKSILYSVYAIVSHSGNMGGGHYVAFVKSRSRIPQAKIFVECARASCADAINHGEIMTKETKMELEKIAEAPVCSTDGQWYYISDTHVSPVTNERAENAEAYILFYERIQ